MKSHSRSTAKRSTTPNIGFDNPSAYFEYCILPAYRAFVGTPQRTNAVAFAIAAWHLNDRLWHYQGKPNREAFVAALMKACPELRLVRDLADAGKHHELNRPSVTVARIEGAEGGGILESFGPLGMTSSIDRGSLQIVEQDGSRHDPAIVFCRVVEFWQSKVR